jgi:geranyl-CoA carboxylase beta subunit
VARIQSQIDATLPAYQENRAAMLALIGEFRALEGKVRALSAARKARFIERGQLLPRDRVDMLLDRGTPFLEIATLAGYRMHDDDGGDNIMGGCLIAGVGVVGATRCMVIASDSAIKGGTIAPMGLQKSLRAQQIAAENKLPVVSLIESGGANLLYQAEIFVLGGRGFYNQARLSAAGIPQVTVVHGSSTAGGAYVPGLSDYVVAVKGRARIFLAGPPLLKAATGEVADEEELGGAEMHTTVSGVADYLAEDDADAIRIARDIVAKLGCLTNWPASCRWITASPMTCARSSRASRTIPISPISSRCTARRRSAARPKFTASVAALSATTARSTPTARSRRRSSSSCAARSACRWSFCRTPPATWWGATPSSAASSSTARR